MKHHSQAQFGRYKLLEMLHYVVTQLLYFLYLSFFSCTDTDCTSFYRCVEAAKKHPAAVDTQKVQICQSL